jgi:hypothetical protein
MYIKNMLCAKFLPINTSLLLFDCTLSTPCEKCEVTTMSRQKMSLKAAKFPPRPKHLLQREHGKAVHIGQAAHSPKHVFSKAEYIVGLSAVLILVFIFFH